MPEPNIDENNSKLLNDIQSLQTMEQQMFNTLETNTTLTSEQQTELISKINQVSSMRVNLYQTLSGLNGYYQNALITSQGTLDDQLSAIQIVENELKQAEQQLNILEEEQNNQIRVVEINTYFGDKYQEHANLMKIVIFTLVPIIILAIINKTGILPNSVYYVLVCIIVAIGAYFFWIRYGSIISRDNMDYQQYDWYFNPDSAPTGSSNSSDPWVNNGTSGSCIGEYCCSTGQTFDASINQCIGDSTIDASDNESVTGDTESVTSETATSTTPVEGFITEAIANNILTKTSTTNKYKQRNPFANPPKPNSNSFINYRNFR